MKNLFENWRKFLKEEEAIEKLYKALGEDQQKIFKTLTAEQQLDLAMEWSQDGMPGGLLMEGVEVDFEVGDVVLGGKYKNKRMVVKEIGKDELGQPTVNGKPMLKFRIEKHLPDNKKSKKTLDLEKEEKEKLDEAKVSKSVLKTLRAWPKGWRGGESPGKYYGNFKKSDWAADDKGYIEDKGRGYYILSDLGREILAANPPEEEKVDEAFLNPKSQGYFDALDGKKRDSGMLGNKEYLEGYEKGLKEREKEKVQEQESGLPPGFQGFDVEEPDEPVGSTAGMREIEGNFGTYASTSQASTYLKPAAVALIKKYGDGRGNIEIYEKGNVLGWAVELSKVTDASTAKKLGQKIKRNLWGKRSPKLTSKQWHLHDLPMWVAYDEGAERIEAPKPPPPRQGTLFENWRKYLNEDVFYVSIDKILPTEELGHGKKHDCPSENCEQQIQDKLQQIQDGNFEPIHVCNQKPIVTARLQGEDSYSPAPKTGQAEPFLYVLDGHHRLEAAKRLGIEKIPVRKVQA